ncbi:MAG: hypothetical protein P8L44_18990 [Opitutales bacterium]|nr:hypothetical protein [Opitutales bacterium]
MDTSFTNSREDIAQAQLEGKDWTSLSRAEQIRSMELEGYLVIPGLLSETQLEAIRKELGKLTTRATDYSPHQRGHSNVQWSDSPNAIDVIAQSTMIEFLTDLFGDEVICTSCTY